ncbi:BirA family transcriptional regulator, biotin operon repressor / biotin-[acetyl-CoA-carboxylase] ligase [Singulisphaera sp. GP187]|uniref:biotin--[acetyl-CoA-carboxylase] ligase n=1 Tax=Singulisphaera sp. GP187 TaxID=1882752 RepID=UPI000929B1B6|nr:biotin--[acetyl-CoA-carboxylase] ligase [Singulisphaera sp. GP187]SIN91405.1 BirA family transcriptional regulator, biotin operon repressor / biotin-[acetyl-CoA-carboxylase] ligase [Singulisphaera sp. GP187]
MNGHFIKTWMDKGVVESTNDLARQVVVNGLGDCPVLVSAERQTRGRGRGNHTWWSDQGSLTFTIGIDPIAHGLRTEHEPRVALATAVALIDALAHWIPRETIRLRWPNDVEVKGLKIAGILPERVETPHGGRLLIGIGINVSTQLDAAPLEIRRMATSLMQQTSGHVSTPADVRDRLLARVIAHFETSISRLAEDDPGLAARWDQLDALRDRPIRLDLGPQILQGIGRGIDPSGALRLGTDQGIRLLYGGQVLRDDLS